MRCNYSSIFASLLATALLFTSCEDVIEFESNEDVKLVVNSFLSQNTGLIVSVSKTKSVVSNEKPALVANAKISVFSNAEFIEFLELNFTADDEPYYKSVLLQPEIGVVYTLKVEVDGMKPATSTTSIPVPVNIKDVVFENTLHDGGDNLSTVQFNVSVTIADPIEYVNYYHLFFYQELISYSVLPNGDTLKSPDIYRGTAITIALNNLEFPHTRHFDKRSFLLDDRTFSGQEISLPFSGHCTFDRSKYLPGNFAVELRTVPREYFDYWVSANNQFDGKDNSLGHPTVIITNIENGEGIFSGYSSTTNFSKISG